MSKIIENQIIELIKENKIVKTKQIQEKLNLPQATARRYLIKLEQAGYIKRNYGENIFIDSRNVEDPNANKNINSNSKIKKKIAKKASDLIQNQKTIYIDSGSSCYYLLDFIDRDIEIYTNSILNANHAIQLGFQNVNIIGGTIKSKTFAIVNANSDFLNSINFPIAFMGVNGIGKKGELTTPEQKESEIKKQIIQRSNKVIVLTERSKFNIDSTYNFRPKNKEIIIVSDYEKEIDFDYTKLIRI